MNSAAALLHARSKAGFTQRQLAERAEVAQSTVARIESGVHEPQVSTLDRLLRACGSQLDVVPVRGIGVDGSLIEMILRATPAERVSAAGRETRKLAAVGL